MTKSGLPGSEGRPSLAEAALFGCCPRCRERTLFVGVVAVPDRCRSCGLDFTAAQAGGRLPLLLTVIVAVLLIVLALWLDEAVRPPLYIHALVWLPLTIVGVLSAIRFSRALSLMHAVRKAKPEDRA
ncbi:DUF983 domain-containing protein [Qipengyuania spongiae]|uniref:DUF983 domain-containing protein n=1 Tax=Qipengyuania spongiae TaxID=2909673 RepID=A0ABY5SV88_9SPHN|nr:DUF983 domain-containing protein [Qipengyuania spongiae]UVI38468.1 DUF983 domain-containing protein [Qipengyuania spongiae]